MTSSCCALDPINLRVSLPARPWRSVKCHYRGNTVPGQAYTQPFVNGLVSTQTGEAVSLRAQPSLRTKAHTNAAELHSWHAMLPISKSGSTMKGELVEP